MNWRNGVVLWLWGVMMIWPSLAFAGWYDNDWGYRVKITSSASQISAAESDIPLYIDLTNMPAAFFANVKSDGSDIVVTTADETTKVDHQLVSIDTTAKTGELHIKAPSISENVGTDFYIYYGNATASDSSTASVWNSFRGVWHLDEPTVAASSVRLGAVTQAAMDGGDGSWAVLYGSDPITTSLKTAADEDQIGDAERSHTTEQMGYWVFGSNAAFDIKDSSGTIIGEVGKISNLTSAPMAETLRNSYTAPIVVTTPNLASAADVPAVVRISGTTATSFTAYLQNPGDLSAPSAQDVYYIVLEAGAYTLPGGTKVEAGSESIDGENRSGNWSNAEMKKITPTNTYADPVVLGQVMSNNDAKWSTFWSSNGTQTGPANSGNIYVGKQVGQDGVTARVAETVGYIIIDTGSGFTNSIEWSADVGADNVSGVGNSPPYSYTISNSTLSGSLKDSTINGFNGSANGTISGEVTGKIGKAVDLSGNTNSRISIGGLSYTNTNNLDKLTASFWLKTSDTARSGILDFDRSEHWQLGLNFHNAGGQNGRISFDTASSNNGIRDLNSASTVNDDQWHHVVAVFDKDDPFDKKIYIDGDLSVQVDGHTSGLGRGTTRFGFIGDGSEASTENGSNNNLLYEGLLDEVRIQHTANSAERILTTYNNQNSNNDFWSFGGEVAFNNVPTAPTTPYFNHTSAQAGAANPTDVSVYGTASRNPYFSAIYNDPDVGDVANMARVQVSTDATFATVTHWDSGFAAIGNVTAGNRSADILYGGIGNAATAALAMDDGDETYFWRIAFADDSGSEGSFSAVQMFSLLDKPSAPTGTSAVKMSGSPDTFTITWLDTSVNESSFEVERKIDTGGGFGSFSAIANSPTAANAVSVADTNTTDNVAYMYRVRACNYAGCSAYVEDAMTHYTEPAAPDTVYGDYVDDNEFTVNFIDRSILGKVDIDRCVGAADCNASTFSSVVSMLVSVKDLAATQTDDDASIVTNQTYRWRVRANNGVVDSHYTFAPFEYTKPAAPTNVAVTFVTDSILKITWTDNSAYEDGFRVLVSEDGGAFTEITAGANTVGMNDTSYMFSSGSSDKSYTFKVRAHIGATTYNSELFSADDTTSTVYTTPAAPTNATSTYNADNDIDVAWTDNSAFEDGFNVLVSINGGAFTTVTTTAANVTSYKYTAGTGDNRYEFAVESKINANAPAIPTDLVNRSNTTDPELFSTPATPALKVSSVGPTAIDWLVTDNSQIEEGLIFYLADGATEVQRLSAEDITFWTEPSLSPNTQYQRSVRAVRQNPTVELISGLSNVVTVFTLANAPGDVTVADLIGSLKVTWTTNSNPGGTEFNALNLTDGSESGWSTDLEWDIVKPECGEVEIQVKSRNGDNVESLAETVVFDAGDCAAVGAAASGGAGGGSTLPSVNPGLPNVSIEGERVEVLGGEIGEDRDAESSVANDDWIPEGCEHPFKDIAEHDAEKYVHHLFCEKIVDGRKDTDFVPEDGITRAEFLKLAIESFDLEAGEVLNPELVRFVDISESDWYFEYIAKGLESEIIEGYFDQEFKPQKEINFAEALKIFLLAAKVEVGERVEGNEWYQRYLDSAKGAEVLQDEVFVPGRILKRSEAAEIFSDTLKLGRPVWDLVVGE